jgi:hypothetical protein
MGDLADYDAVAKELKKIVDSWSKTIKDGLAELAKLQAEADKKGDDDDDDDTDADLKKKQEAVKKNVQQATDAMKKNIYNFSVSPKADPKPFANLPKLVKDVVDKGGIPLGDSGITLAPDNWKFDPPPHFKVKSGGFVLKWKF